MRTSVVIPTRNRGDLVVQAVRSALAAAQVDEVVVADGGSTDGSLERLRQLGDRVRVISGNWHTAAATRNAAAAAATGDLLAFLDSDDLMDREKVPHLGPYLLGDASVALVHGTTTVIDANGTVDVNATRAQQAQIHEGSQRGTTYSALAAYCSMYTSATIVRHSAFDAIGGYDESLEVYEDWDLYLRLALKYRLMYTPALAASYRRWPGNVAWSRTAEWTARVAEKHLEQLPSLPAPELRAARYAFLARLANSNHVLVRTSESRRAAVQALRVDARRAVRDPLVRGAFLRSFVPAGVLTRRRPL